MTVKAPRAGGAVAPAAAAQTMRAVFDSTRSSLESTAGSWRRMKNTAMTLERDTLRHNMLTEPAQVPRRAHSRRPDAYIAPSPETVNVTTLEHLIGGIRTIMPEQQQRLQRFDSIYTVGNAELLKRPCVAIVGTREVTPDGAVRSRRLARELSAESVVIVSGLARGVDTEALTAAIHAGGKVAAVIGTPVDRVYPAENSRLQETIYREHLLVSQFRPGERVYPSNFPERNKLMAALSDATVIIEAGDTSGSLHQAAECVRLGRWLFITKSVVDDSSLKWPSRFLGNPTVRILTDSSDVMSALRAN